MNNDQMGLNLRRRIDFWMQVFNYVTMFDLFHFYENIDILLHKRLLHNNWEYKMAEIFRSIFRSMHNRRTGVTKTSNVIFMLRLETFQHVSQDVIW